MADVINKKRKFPTWAPKSLIEWLDLLPSEGNWITVRNTATGQGKWQITFFPPELPKKEIAELVYRWATDERMEDAWMRIKTFEGDLTDDAAYFICRMAIGFLAEFKSTPKMTKSKKQKHFSDITAKAQELETLLNGCVEFRTSNLSEYLSDEQVSNLAHSISNVSFGAETDFNAAATRGECNVDSTRRVFSLPTCAPAVPELLAQLAAKAKSEQAKPPLAAHPDGVDAEIKFLIDQLSRLMVAANWQTTNVTTDVIVRAFVRAAYHPIEITDERVRTARMRALS
jgi:hypothetical protein